MKFGDIQSNQLKKLWADFVWELRRQGYWSNPEKYKGFWAGWTMGECEYAKTIEDISYHKSADGLIDGAFNLKRSWLHWSEEDRKKAEEEYEKLSSNNPILEEITYALLGLFLLGFAFTV